MIEIFVLSPGWLGNGSQRRGRAARLYARWFWDEHADMRLLDCCCSFMLRPFEWLFPVVKIDRRFVVLGLFTTAERINRLLNLQGRRPHGYLIVEPGDPVL